MRSGALPIYYRAPLRITLKRRSAQTVLHLLLNTVAAGIAPIAAHLSEELYSFGKGVDPTKEPTPSILRQGWPVRRPHGPNFDCTPLYSVNPAA